MAEPIKIHAYSEDLLEKAAEQIIEDNLAQLPDISHCVILLPSYNAASPFRQQLLAKAKSKGFSTLIGPRVFLFRDYILKNTLVSNQQLSGIAAELLIIQSLKENPDLFGSRNTLASSYALLEMIQELTRHQVVLPSSFESFKQQLENAYQAQADAFEALGHEAKLVFSIWQAWHQQLKTLDCVDKESLYQIKLGQNLQQSQEDFFYLVGNQQFLTTEIRWLQKKLASNKLKIFLQCESAKNNIHPDAFGYKLLSQLNIEPTFATGTTAKNQFLSLIYEQNPTSLNDKVAEIQKTFPHSPIKDQINLLLASDFEEEARAIQTQIRIWMQQGLKNIAFISEDRRLARRVRALLERHGIGLHDNEGWALSTSNTASLVESLLEAIEENFNHTALLHLLKSHFLFSDDAINSKAVYRLEQEVIQHEKVYSDIQRYKTAVLARQKRLQAKDDEVNQHLFAMLEKINTITGQLQAIHEQGQAKVSVFCQTLLNCILELTQDNGFQEDVAGRKIIELLSNIISACDSIDASLSWTELRQWFAGKLEEATFTVDTNFRAQVRYLHLNQTNLMNFEAIIIGNCSREHFPGKAKMSPFFNQQVYQELGLADSYQQLQETFYYFRRLLDASNQVCLSFHRGEEELQLSPWLEMLENIHQLAFKESLNNQALLAALNTAPEQVRTTPQEMAKASVPAEKLPQRISASAHQALINCPYTYFLSEVLKLRAPEEIRLTLAKSDYGERIHFILFLFHQGGVAGYPPPFTEKLSNNNKAQAIERLKQISEKVFQQDLEDNFLHRGWLQRWQENIPRYINWQISEQEQWQFARGEISDSNAIYQNFEAYGRIDRIDTGSTGARIIDYKTGSFPKQADIESGESVQLSHYALASKQAANELAYLALESKTDSLKTTTILDENNLEFTRQGVQQRLIDMLEEMGKGAGLPAWGDDSV
ncbi:MAG: PD-(D/E)XK nuclease family protein, partial [Gammaproteobacteria bacterium]|nr:PD-(D/E)XK nuclease family protein [Gammaproteobacteria bacterium]